MSMSVARARISTRDRILKEAKRLFQRNGYHAVGTAEILQAANAPKGSMYHHFPGGKEDIAVAAVKEIRAEVLASMNRLRTRHAATADCVRALATGMAHWLGRTHYREGTMLASITVGSVPDLPRLHAAIKQTFDEWRDQLAAWLCDEGWTKHAAAAMATTALAAMEGAMLVARVARKKTPIIHVANVVAESMQATR